MSEVRWTGKSKQIALPLETRWRRFKNWLRGCIGLEGIYTPFGWSDPDNWSSDQQPQMGNDVIFQNWAPLPKVPRHLDPREAEPRIEYT